jgi:carbonic anhydrase
MKRAEVLSRLKTGNEKYVQDKLSTDKVKPSKRKALIKGQDPYAIILCCADSRVIPELIFDTGIGELFVVRVAGNIANMSSMASIEYAVAHIGTQIIVVLGHQNCGAVTAAVNSEDRGPNLNHLLSHIKPAIEASGKDDSINDIARKNAVLTAKALCENSSIIGEADELGKIDIFPAYYHLDTGKVDFLN